MEISYSEYLKSIGEEEELNRPKFTLGFINSHLYLEDGDEPYDGGSYLSMGLGSSSALNDIADSIRMARGYIPFFTENENGDYYDDAWYNYYLTFYSSGRVGIDFNMDCDSDIEDARQSYEIKLTKEEQDNLYEAFKESFKQNLEWEIKRDEATGRFEWVNLYDLR